MFTHIAHTSVSNLTHPQLLQLRACINGNKTKAFIELYDETLELVVSELKVTEDIAETRLKAYVLAKLKADDAETASNWQGTLEENLAQFAEVGVPDSTTSRT